MKKSIYLLGLLLLVACANDDEPTGQQVPNAYPLTIEVTENPLIPDGEEGSSTRAAITTISTLTTFYLNYQYNSVYSEYDNKQSITNASGTWNGGSWPSDVREGDPDVNVTWYAYTGGTFNWTENNPKEPYVSFTVEELATNQKDLLVATASGTYKGTSGKLTFNFNHACAALRFWIKKSTNMSGYKLEIKEVVLCNVIKQAKYYYASGWAEWYSDRSVYTLYSSTSNYTLDSSGYIAMDGGTPNYLFMIPQALTAWDSSTTTIAEATTQTYLKVKCTITKTNPNTVICKDSYAYIPFGATLVAGKKYDVKINVGKNSLLNSSGIKIVN